MNINLELNDVEIFFLKRALDWRIQNIDYVIEKKKLEGLKKANYLSEKSTLMNIAAVMSELVTAEESKEQEDGIGETVATSEPEEVVKSEPEDVVE